MATKARIVILGLSITSSWGNGHATTYRALSRALSLRGHDVTFLERDVPWYAHNRDLPDPPYARTFLYENLADLRARFAEEVRQADLVIVGSYVPDGIAVGDWVLEIARGVTAFYDIDTPVTLECLEKGGCDYLARAQVAAYDAYLSFTGGPTLDLLERTYGSPRAEALYCSAEPRPFVTGTLDAGEFDLGYMGTYSADRQPGLRELLVVPALRLRRHRFVVAGPQFPPQEPWPANVVRIEHLSPGEHDAFYASQRYTLNLTRAAMRATGYSPSVRLFEAAAAGVAVISDTWPGIEEFFEPQVEILTARTRDDVVEYLEHVSDEDRRRIGERARERLRADHTPERRAEVVERIIGDSRADTGLVQDGRGEARVVSEPADAAPASRSQACVPAERGSGHRTPAHSHA